jgi:hypothetical protein
MLKDTADMNAMRAAAQNRWEAGKEKEVSEDEWKSFANSFVSEWLLLRGTSK